MTGADVLKISAPIIAMGGVWVARKALSGGYQAATGNQPPSADDLDAPLSQVTRYFATYNLVAIPVVDENDHLLGAITVDDVASVDADRCDGCGECVTECPNDVFELRES